jgi:hypothetical protein
MTIGNCRRNQSPGAVSCRHRKMKVEKGFLTGRGKAWFRRHTLAHPIETDGENESTGADWRRKQVKQRKTRDEDPGRPRPETMSGDANGSRAPDAKHGQEKETNRRAGASRPTSGKRIPDRTSTDGQKSTFDAHTPAAESSRDRRERRKTHD